MTAADAAPALILTLGGAPLSAHRIAGVDGLYRPDRPTPVGGPGEATAAAAAAAHEDPGVPLALVRVPLTDVPALRYAHDADIRAERGLPPRSQ